jgi:hypothetical protein
MTPTICNSTSTSLIATSEKNLQISNKIVIEERVASSYEACYWIIAAEDNKFRDDTSAYIELKLESLSNAVAYIYDGTDRGNATAFIEKNATAVLGAPFRAPISAKLILVTYTVPGPNVLSGSISFSY